jgi:hypothetical protein
MAVAWPSALSTECCETGESAERTSGESISTETFRLGAGGGGGCCCCCGGGGGGSALSFAIHHATAGAGRPVTAYHTLRAISRVTITEDGRAGVSRGLGPWVVMSERADCDRSHHWAISRSGDRSAYLIRSPLEAGRASQRTESIDRKDRSSLCFNYKNEWMLQRFSRRYPLACAQVEARLE